MPAPSPSSFRLVPGRQIVAGLAAAVALVGVAGCSSPAPSKAELSDALVASGLSQKVADCTASALTGSLTRSELAELTERGAGGAPVDDPAKDDDGYDKIQKAMASCRELQAQAAPTSTTAAPATGGKGSATTVTVADGTEGAELNPASTTTTAAP